MSVWDRLDRMAGEPMDHPSGERGCLAAVYPAQGRVTIRAYGSGYQPILYVGTLKGAEEAGWPLGVLA